MESSAPIGQLLVQRGYIDNWQLQSALAHQRSWGGRIGEALVKLGFMSEPVLLTEIARQLRVPYVQIGDRCLPQALVRLVPEKLIRARKIFPVPFAWRDRRSLLVVATAEPQNLIALDEVSFAAGKTVKAALAGDRDITLAIERHLGPPPGWTSMAAAPRPMPASMPVDYRRRAA